MVTPDGKTVYVTNFNEHRHADQHRDQHGGRSDPGGERPAGVAVSPDGKTVYVTNCGSNTVTPIDTATNTAGAPIPVGSSAGVPRHLRRTAMRCWRAG